MGPSEFTLTGLEIGAGHATLHVLTPCLPAYPRPSSCAPTTTGLVDRFDVSLVPPVIKSWRDIDDEIAKTGAKYSYQVSKVDDGECDPLAGTNVDLSLPLASIFKLYVLLAVSEGVKTGAVSWDDQLLVTKEGKAVGAAGLDEVPDGTTVSVRTAAQQMISASDNMATDLLIQRLGAGAIERALVTARHHDPASMTPFPTTHELFSVGSGKPNLREQWQNVSSSEAGRAQLFEQTDTRPYDPDPERTHTPASDIGAEWYGSAADILPRARGASGFCCRCGSAGEADPFGHPRYRTGPREVAVHRRQGREPTRQPDVQLVCGRPGRAAVCRQLPVELAEVSQSDRSRLAAVDSASDLRPGARRLTA